MHFHLFLYFSVLCRFKISKVKKTLLLKRLVNHPAFNPVTW